MKRKTGMTQEVRECLAEMGVTDEVMAKIRAASNHTDGQKALDEAKEICRKGFRSIAARYHPDHNQHLSDGEREEKISRFKRMRSVHDDFMKSRYRGPRRSNTRKAARNFDPFGYASYENQEVEDELRYWSDPLMHAFAKRKREQERRKVASVYEEIRKRMYWESLGLNYDIMSSRQDSKPKATVLAGHKGVWYPDLGKWISRTSRSKKSQK